MKNRNDICYIYDDYDINDEYFEIKAVGLNPSEYFTALSNYFIKEIL